jgi:putative restriction endonuclease
MFIADHTLRLAAYRRVQQLIDTSLTWPRSAMLAGITSDGERMPLCSAQRGIFKPRQMQQLLSITTVVPRSGGRIWYEDQRWLHGQLSAGADGIDYAFMGRDPHAADNRWLREACEHATPIIFFIGVAPARYTAVAPAFIVDWSAARLTARVSFGLPGEPWWQMPASFAERRYATRVVARQIARARFRDAALHAYGQRCAMSGSGRALLLDAVLIDPVDDLTADTGVPLAAGLVLDRSFGAAFAADLLGVDADHRIHAAAAVLYGDDHPSAAMWRAVHGRRLFLPHTPELWPDRERLARRFERFRASA